MVFDFILDKFVLVSLTMKTAAVFFLAALATAAPPADLERRQVGGSEMVANDLHSGPCKEVTFIWVRGTTETANLVSDKTLAYIVTSQPVLLC